MSIHIASTPVIPISLVSLEYLTQDLTLCKDRQQKERETAFFSSLGTAYAPLK